MVEKKMLAIDLGASSGRGIIGTFDGKKLTLSENHRFSNDPVNVSGRMYWDILRIFHEIKQSILKANLAKENISSIGIDTWGVDYAYLDKQGRMLANPTHYRDVRTQDAVEYSGRFFTLPELYEETGIQTISFNTIFQILCDVRENPDIFEKADRILQIPDLLNYFLTGKKVNEYTILSTGAILNAKARDYSQKILEKAGIPRRLFGDVVQPGTNLGGILPELQEEVGKTDATVYTVASHDTASAVLAVPTTHEKFIFISSGTWSLMGTEISEPCMSQEAEEANLTNEGGVNGKIRFLKNIMGLWIIQESRRQWKREGQEYSFAQLEAFAREEEPFRSFIMPDDPSFITPGNMPERIREYCRKTGQKVPETVGQVIRCIYESLALKYRKTIECIENTIGYTTDVIHIVGGGTKDTFLSQMTADACNKPVLTGPEEATAVGNLMMQLIASGDVKDVTEARQIVTNSFERKKYVPTENREAWEKAYTRFAKLN